MAQKITHFPVGSVWQPQATFTVGSTATDPTTLTVLQQNAAGVETTVASSSSVAAMTSASTPVAKMSTGVFKLNPGITVDASGYWFIKFIGQGAAAATKQEQIIVDPDEFTSNAGLSDRALVSLAETKDWLNQQNINVSEDLELVRTINDVSDRIHQEAEREFKPIMAGTATRSFVVDNYTRYLDVGDMATLSTSSPATVVGIDWTTTIYTFASTDVRALPLVRQSWEPITKLEINVRRGFLIPGMRVDVTGTWGFPSVPGNIRQAALDAIAAIMDRDVEHYRQDLGTVTPGGEAGNLVVVQGAPPMLLSMPPSSVSVARSYRRPNLG